jgi:threonine/homoserine/homoserine lactone efflux protein
MEHLLTLFHVAMIWMLAVVTPGANVLLTINTALHYDRKLAMFSAFGVSSAILLWAFFGGSGLAILFLHFPELFGLMKIIGGGYLFYLGTRQIYLTRKKKRLSESTESYPAILPSKRRVFMSAFITSILNPKTGFFVVSLFSIFVSENMSAMMILAIMLIMFTITLCWHLFLAMTFSHRSAKSVYGRISGVIDYVTGGLFTIFGIRVMTS